MPTELTQPEGEPPVSVEDTGADALDFRLPLLSHATFDDGDIDPDMFHESLDPALTCPGPRVKWEKARHWHLAGKDVPTGVYLVWHRGQWTLLWGPRKVDTLREPGPAKRTGVDARGRKVVSYDLPVVVGKWAHARLVVYVEQEKRNERG